MPCVGGAITCRPREFAVRPSRPCTSMEEAAEDAPVLGSGIQAQVFSPDNKGEQAGEGVEGA